MKRWALPLCWLLWSTVHAQDDSCPISVSPHEFDESFALAMFQMRQPVCYTELDLYTTLTAQITRRFFTSEQMTDVGTAATAAANHLLNDFNQRVDVNALQTPIASFARAFVDELESARTRFDEQSWSVGPWMLVTNDTTTHWSHLNSALEREPESCGDEKLGENAVCDQRFVQVLLIAPYLFVMHDLVESATDEIRGDYEQFMSVNLAEWNDYFSETQFHYTWELLLNRWIYNRRSSDQQDEHNNIVGFRPAPNFKLNALHPDIGYSYISHQQSGLRHETALLFEWVGFQAWSDDNNLRFLKPAGIGLVSTFVDIPNLDRSGFGLVFHYGKFGLAWSKHDSSDVWTVNVDLLRFLEDSDGNLAESLKRRRSQQ